MTRRGLAPTGIAIYEAQERGFASVAHYVQAKLLKGKQRDFLEPEVGWKPKTGNLADHETSNWHKQSSRYLGIIDGKLEMLLF